MLREVGVSQLRYHGAEMLARGVVQKDLVAALLARGDTSTEALKIPILQRWVSKFLHRVSS